MQHEGLLQPQLFGQPELAPLNHFAKNDGGPRL